MKSLAASLILLLACVPLALAHEAAKTAKIEELLKLTNGERMMTQMFDQVKTVALAQLDKMSIPPEHRQLAQQTQEQIITILQNALSWDKMKPVMVKVYDETFTEEEVDGILNFYKTPAGQALLEKMPTLMQRSMAAGQQLVGDVMPQIRKMVEDLKKKAEQQEDTNSPPPH